VGVNFTFSQTFVILHEDEYLQAFVSVKIFWFSTLPLVNTVLSRMHTTKESQQVKRIVAILSK